MQHFPIALGLHQAAGQGIIIPGLAAVAMDGSEVWQLERSRMSTATFPRGIERSRTRQEPGLVCVKCGGAMLEADHVTEDGCTYIWYECNTPGCQEQWLTKKVARMM